MVIARQANRRPSADRQRARLALERQLGDLDGRPAGTPAPDRWSTGLRPDDPRCVDNVAVAGRQRDSNLLWRQVGDDLEGARCAVDMDPSFVLRRAPSASQRRHVRVASVHVGEEQCQIGVERVGEQDRPLRPCSRAEDELALRFQRDATRLLSPS